MRTWSGSPVPQAARTLATVAASTSVEQRRSRGRVTQPAYEDRPPGAHLSGGGVRVRPGWERVDQLRADHDALGRGTLRVAAGHRQARDRRRGDDLPVLR